MLSPGTTRKSTPNRQSPAVMLCAVPPAIWPTCTVVQGGSKIAAKGVTALARFSSFTAFAQSISFAPHMIAFTPRCIIEECTS